MFQVKKVDALIKVKEKIINISVKSLDLFNVKLHDINKQVSDDSFYDIGDSVDFQDEFKSFSKGFADFNEISQFTISSSGHFCVEEILALSQSES